MPEAAGDVSFPTCCKSRVEESQVVLSLVCIQQQWEVAVGKPLDVIMTGTQRYCPSCRHA